MKKELAVFRQIETGTKITRRHRLRDLLQVHLVGVIIGGGLFLLPLLYIIFISFKSTQGFLTDPFGFPKQFHWDNYVKAWQQASMASYFLNSIIYAVFSTALSLMVSVLLAFPISRKYIKYSNLLYIIFLIGMFLPGALIPLFTESRALHLYDNRIGYIILSAGTGLNFFFFVGYIKTIPKELDEAAALDSSGYFTYIFRILLPLMKPALATMGLFGFIGSWNNLIAPVVFLSNSKLWPLTRGLFGFFGEYSNNWPLLCAALIIVLSPLVILFIILQRYMVAGVTGGAVKH